VLLGEGDAFVIDQAGMLDGIDASPDGVFDGLRAVSVSGDFAAKLVGFFGNGLHLFESELGSPGLIAFAENAAGSTDFDDVSTVLHHFANFSAGSPGTVGDTFGFVVKLGGQKIVVAVAAGDAKRRAGDAHARTLDVASVNTIAESDIGVAARADVADGGKAGAKGEASVLHACDSFPWNGNAEACVAVARGFTGKMSVDIDQPRETRGIRKINRGDAVQELRRRRGTD